MLYVCRSLVSTTLFKGMSARYIEQKPDLMFLLVFVSCPYTLSCSNEVSDSFIDIFLMFESHVEMYSDQSGLRHHSMHACGYTCNTRKCSDTALPLPIPDLIPTPHLIPAWARKRGYFIRTRGGPDAFRAANELLRFCLNGQKSLVLYLQPPGYSQKKGESVFLLVL